jgi:biopolymer transport protein ExbB
MIVAFGGIAGGLAAGAGVDGETLTGGIAQALITTGAGLVVAIPATIIHHLLRQRVEGFVTALEEAIRDVVLTVQVRSARAAGRAPSTTSSSATATAR